MKYNIGMWVAFVAAIPMVESGCGCDCQWVPNPNGGVADYVCQDCSVDPPIIVTFSTLECHDWPVTPYIVVPDDIQTACFGDFAVAFGAPHSNTLWDPCKLSAGDCNLYGAQVIVEPEPPLVCILDTDCGNSEVQDYVVADSTLAYAAVVNTEPAIDEELCVWNEDTLVPSGLLVTQGAALAAVAAAKNNTLLLPAFRAVEGAANAAACTAATAAYPGGDWLTYGLDYSLPTYDCWNDNCDRADGVVNNPGPPFNTPSANVGNTTYVGIIDPVDSYVTITTTSYLYGTATVLAELTGAAGIGVGTYDSAFLQGAAWQVNGESFGSVPVDGFLFGFDHNIDMDVASGLFDVDPSDVNPGINYWGNVDGMPVAGTLTAGERTFGTVGTTWTADYDDTTSFLGLSYDIVIHLEGPVETL